MAFDPEYETMLTILFSKTSSIKASRQWIWKQNAVTIIIILIASFCHILNKIIDNKNKQINSYKKQRLDLVLTIKIFDY